MQNARMEAAFFDNILLENSLSLVVAAEVPRVSTYSSTPWTDKWAIHVLYMQDSDF